MERISASWRPVVPPQDQPLWRQRVGIALTFFLVILAWVPFRWELDAALQFWEALLNWSAVSIQDVRVLATLPLLLGSLMLDLVQNRSGDEFIFLRWSPLTKAACMAIVLFWVFILLGGDFEQPFVYQGF
jgi:hypothetical protein